MTTVMRRSPLLAPDFQKQDVRDAVATLEQRPRISEGTPASGAADGYEGEIKSDGSYLYLYRNGEWKRTQLTTF